MRRVAVASLSRGKLVSIIGEPRREREQAMADFRILNRQEGSLGGGVESETLPYSLAKLRGYDKLHYAVIFMIWPMSAPMLVGSGVATRAQAKKFGVKVPRGVDA